VRNCEELPSTVGRQRCLIWPFHRCLSNPVWKVFPKLGLSRQRPRVRQEARRRVRRVHLQPRQRGRRRMRPRVRDLGPVPSRLSGNSKFSPKILFGNKSHDNLENRLNTVWIHTNFYKIFLMPMFLYICNLRFMYLPM
jgi:hypothetical protein